MTSKKVPTIKLNSGHEMPVFGLGTWLSKPGEVREAVRIALENGYPAIDCARAYDNENEVGEGLQAAFEKGIKREDIFITSKLWNTDHRPERVRVGLEHTLKDLRLKYLDLYLLHWPFAFKSGDELFPKDDKGNNALTDDDYLPAYKGMEDLVDAGLVKSIGVCNLNKEQLQRILDNCRIKPAMMQMEIHPMLLNKEVADFCKSQGIAVTAYSPLGNPGVADEVNKKKINLIEDPKVKEIAKKHNKDPGQVLIRFPIERGFCVVAKSVHEKRIKSNFEVFDFKLDKDDLEKLSGFKDQHRIVELEWAAKNKYYPF